jgi:hypothetical protein
MRPLRVGPRTAVSMCGCSSRTLAADRARLSLIEPLGTRARLELFGERNVIDGDEAQSVYDLESGTPMFIVRGPERRTARGLNLAHVPG